MAGLSSANFSLEGRRALVTGGTRGIGLAIAKALGVAGASVVISGRAGPHAEAALESLLHSGMCATFVAADLSQDDAVEALPALAAAAYGQIDILVNNAGIDPVHAVQDTPLDAWRQTIRINLEIPFRLSQALGSGMAASGKGSIINISSVLGLTGGRNQCAYISSKHGLVGMTKSMAIEWGASGVRVNAIAPGIIETDMSSFLWDQPDTLSQMLSRIPAGKVGKVSDIAAVALFLASDAACYVNGQTLAVDGGRLAS